MKILVSRSNRNHWFDQSTRNVLGAAVFRVLWIHACHRVNNNYMRRVNERTVAIIVHICPNPGASIQAAVAANQKPRLHLKARGSGRRLHESESHASTIDGN